MARSGHSTDPPVRSGRTRAQARTVARQQAFHGNCGEDLECDGSGLCGLEFRNDVMKAHMSAYRISADSARDIHVWIENVGVRYHLLELKKEELDDIKNHGLLLITLGRARTVEAVMKLADEIVVLSTQVLQGLAAIHGGPTRRQLFRVARTVAAIADMGSVPGASWHGPDAAKSRTAWQHKTVACMVLSMVMDLHRSPEGYFAKLLGRIEMAEYWKVYPVVDAAPSPACLDQQEEGSDGGQNLSEADKESGSESKAEDDALAAADAGDLVAMDAEDQNRFVLSALEESDDEDAFDETETGNQSACSDTEESRTASADRDTARSNNTTKRLATAALQAIKEDSTSAINGNRLDSSDGESEMPAKKKPRLSESIASASAMAVPKLSDSTKTQQRARSNATASADRTESSEIESEHSVDTPNSTTKVWLPHKSRRSGGGNAKGGRAGETGKKQRKWEKAEAPKNASVAGSPRLEMDGKASKAGSELDESDKGIGKMEKWADERVMKRGRSKDGIE